MHFLIKYYLYIWNYFIIILQRVLQCHHCSYIYSCERNAFHNVRNVNRRVMLNKSRSTPRVVRMSARISASGHLHKAARKKRLKCIFPARPVRSFVPARIHFCNYDDGAALHTAIERAGCSRLRATRASLFVGGLQRPSAPSGLA